MLHEDVSLWRAGMLRPAPLGEQGAGRGPKEVPHLAVVASAVVGQRQVQQQFSGQASHFPLLLLLLLCISKRCVVSFHSSLAYSIPALTLHSGMP